MTPNEVIQGNQCFVYIKNGDDWYLIGCGISCQFELENEIILRTSVNDGLFPKKRVRQTDWRGSVSAVMIDNSDSEKVSAFYLAQEAVRRAERTYKFEFTSVGGTTKIITGDAVIRSIPMSADQTSFAKFDLSIEGTGGFTLDETDSPTDVIDENVDSDYWTFTAGETSITGNSVNGKNTTGKTILAVSREGVAHDPITSGTPSGRQAKFSTSTGTTSFDSSLPSNGETVWQMWKDS